MKSVSLPLTSVAGKSAILICDGRRGALQSPIDSKKLSLQLRPSHLVRNLELYTIGNSFVVLEIFRAFGSPIVVFMLPPRTLDCLVCHFHTSAAQTGQLLS
jgi:hypothetical protein